MDTLKNITLAVALFAAGFLVGMNEDRAEPVAIADEIIAHVPGIESAEDSFRRECDNLLTDQMDAIKRRYRELTESPAYVAKRRLLSLEKTYSDNYQHRWLQLDEQQRKVKESLSRQILDLRALVDSYPSFAEDPNRKHAQKRKLEFARVWETSKLTNAQKQLIFNDALESVTVPDWFVESDFESEFYKVTGCTFRSGGCGEFMGNVHVDGFSIN